MTTTNPDNFWLDRSVLVTGAAGFTGRNLVKALVGVGARVHAVMRTGGTQAQFSKAVTVHSADLRNSAACAGLLRDAQERDGRPLDTVFHVAAVFRTVGVSRQELYESHVSATEHLLRASLSASVRRFLHVSTIGVQGPNPPPAAQESAPACPADDYQETKYEGECAALAFGAEHDLAVTVVRPCAIYGAGDDRFLKIIRPISRGRFPLIGDGHGLFHLVHVEDLARGMMSCAEADKTVGEVLTIGGEQIPTLREFVDQIAAHSGGGILPLKIPYSLVYGAGYLCEKICAVIGVEPPLHRRRVKFFGSNRSFDLSKAKELANFEPSVTLESGLADLISWHERRGDL